MKTIVCSPQAAKELDALPRADAERISDALHSYAITGLGDIKRLSDRDGYRLRVGRYRVIFDQDAATILAIYIGTRQTATYRRH
jgi:mRNA interferase RelE/StbE